MVALGWGAFLKLTICPEPVLIVSPLFLAENLSDRQALFARVFGILELRQYVHEIFSRADPVHHLVLVGAESNLGSVSNRVMNFGPRSGL